MYAIEIIGYGRRRRYCIKKLMHNGTMPVDGHAYKTEKAAREAAARLGVVIDRVGGLWDIV